MKSSVYKLNHGVYLAVLDGQQITRGSIEGLADALVQRDIAADDLLLGDWREGAELLNAAEQAELRVALAAGKQLPRSVPGSNVPSERGLAG